MRSIIQQVDDFIISSYTNLWLEDDILNVYVRKGKRYIEGNISETFDVANILSINKKYEKQGYFKAFMLKVEELGMTIFVECIHNPKLTEMLQKNGYTIIKNQYECHAYKFPNVDLPK